MIQSDIVSWSAAILLSLLVHGMILMQSGAAPGMENSPVIPSPLITRLSFSQPADNPVLDMPRPLEKPPQKPASKAGPVPVRAKLKKPRVQPVEEHEPVRRQVSKPQARGRQVVQHSDGLLQPKRQQYLRELFSHIESHKFYPRAARRRAIEGDVKISFNLRDDGSYEQLVLDGGRTILVKAARQALESAIPLPVPPADAGLTDRIEFTMAYSLTR